MWRTLPHQGTAIRKLETHRANELVIVPVTGERIRLAVRGSADIETVGNVAVRTEADAQGLRVTFTSPNLVLERAEVSFDGDEREWEEIWRRARARSLPWWSEGDADELDLDWVLDVRLRLVGERKDAG